MKKFISIILSVLMLASFAAFPACKAPEKAQDTDIRIAALKGPTGMGMVKLIGDEYPHYKVSIEASPDALAPRFIISSSLVMTESGLPSLPAAAIVRIVPIGKASSIGFSQ